LYFHGFPGCGLEAGVFLAREVAREGGCIYAIDRPGMGKTSSPYKKSSSNGKDAKDIANRNIETLMDNIWELIEDQGWEEFSIIGMSGGGPYALALLASYLRRRQCPSSKTKEVVLPARLRNVCLLCCICLSAGPEGMMKDNKKLVAVVEKAQTSRWKCFELRVAMRMMGNIYYYLIPALPFSKMKYFLKIDEFPPADRELISDESKFGPYMSIAKPMMTQGGYPGVYDDIMICMQKGHPDEEFLREKYGDDDDNDDLPPVGIFQGLADINVPPSHARYMHESIFHKRSRLFEYEGMGHLSLVEQ
jgi:pimeloyl-ACP methyl ester carboxylesterase